MNVSLSESYAWCKRLARRTAGNFYFAFLTLPRSLRRDMCALYAFMRLTDDIGDDATASLPRRSAALAQWRRSLDDALIGATDDRALWPALVDVVQRCDIPAEFLHTVIDGVEGDLQPGGFEDFAELSDYCYRVAGVVGRCCIRVWGYEDDRADELAVDCGRAFQLTNVIRDVAEDARLGRVYLPQCDLLEFGCNESDLTGQHAFPNLRELLAFEANRAREDYRRAEGLFDVLAPRGRPVLDAMLRIYGGLLDEIERRNYDVFSRRVALSRWKKLRIATGAMVRHRWFGTGRSRDSTSQAGVADAAESGFPS